MLAHLKYNIYPVDSSIKYENDFILAESCTKQILKFKLTQRLNQCNVNKCKQM